MSFLQPAFLLALPLVMLPLVIHLIHQRRYQTMPWGAMQFLLTATRMSRGYARLRQWLILLLRMLVIGALVLALSRPLASGRFSLSGRADTTILLLDRSPSMEQLVGGVSKLTAMRQQMAKTLQTVGSARWVLIDSAARAPREIAAPAALLEMPEIGPTSASADLPALLRAAHDYIEANQTGRTEIWIGTDLRASDWRVGKGQWRDLRSGFLEFAQRVRFHLLALPRMAPENLAVRVTNLHKISTGAGAELSLALKFTREAILAEEKADVRDTNRVERPVTFPVQVEVEGARSELAVQMAGSHYALQDTRIALAGHQRRGWGRVSIPADANRADNEFYFAFDAPPPRRTFVVAEDTAAAGALLLAASIGPNRSISCQAEVVPSGQLETAAWEEIALLLWQAPLPVGATAALMQSFVEQGGQVLFLPPREPGGGEWLGAHWGNWIDSQRTVTWWRGDEGLLANTESGAALPVSKLSVHRFCTLAGELTPLATLAGGEPLLARATTERGGVYFLATTLADSTLATSGVVWYVAIQRALTAGAMRLAGTGNLVAGEVRAWSTFNPQVPMTQSKSAQTPPSAGAPRIWRRLAGDLDALSTDYADHGGVYETDGRLVAVNRPIAEDNAPVLTDAEISELFAGLDFVRVDGSRASDRGLIDEIWRTFLALMMVAMLVEAVLCLPKGTRKNKLIIHAHPKLEIRISKSETNSK